MGYNLTVQTGNVSGGGTDGTVKVRFNRDNYGLTDWFTLDHAGNDFEAGSRDTYHIDASVNIQPGTALEVELDPTGLGSDWHLEWITVVEDGTNKTWHIAANTWFQRSKEVTTTNTGGDQATHDVAGILNQLFPLTPVNPGDQRIYLSSFDGRAWSPYQALSAVTDKQPTLAAVDTTLFLAWKGRGDQTLWWTSTTDGQNWREDQQQPEGSSWSRPSLAPNPAKNGVVQIARGGDGNTTLWSSTFGDGAWQPSRNLGIGSSSDDGPTAAQHHDGLFLAWQGSGGDQQIWWSASADGLT
ncbi:PLAT/LH2 domain-containing protein [Nocardia sp. NPDC058640]